MREIIRVPAGTALRITVNTSTPKEFRLILADKNTNLAFFDEIILVEKEKTVKTKFFQAEAAVVLVIKPVNGGKDFTYSIKRLRKRWANMTQTPSQSRSRIIRRGGNPQNRASSTPADTGNFLVQAADSSAYVLQAADGSKITLNS